MCVARNPALQGGNEKQKVNASKVFLQQSLQHVEKCRQERNVCQHMANLGLQNRGWSVPSREKNDQKGRQMQQDAKNAPKKRLRAKNVPKWPQHAEFGFRSRFILAPPSKEKQYVKRNKCLWGLTRLALQAAQRTWLPVGSPRGTKIEAETPKNRC